MLSSTDLANTLSGAMNKTDNAADAHSNFTSALKDYITNNIQILGVYTGLLPNGSPDPLNGSYTWKNPTWSISASNIQTGATTGLSGWEIALLAECLKITFTGADSAGSVTVPATTLIVSSLSIDMSGKPDNMNDAFRKVADGIITALKSATAISSAATSTGGGTGMVVWGAVS